MTSDQAKAYLYIGGGLLGVYVLWHAVDAGQKAAKSVTDLVTGLPGAIADTVSGGVKAAVDLTQTAYAETATFLTGQQHYSPSALDGSLSRTDALLLADENNARNAARWERQQEIDDIATNGTVTGVPL